MKVFIAGEGPDELGDWARHPAYRPTKREDYARGIIIALLARGGIDVEVIDASLWKHIPKFRAGDHRHPETRTVLGLALRAEEKKCDALVFVRDRDRDEGREQDLEAGISDASARFSLTIAGGMAVEETEAWILALLGERGSERHADAKSTLATRHEIESCADMVEVIDNADLTKLPDDAVSLRRWLERARALSDS
jgi:hypothetical protein